MKTIRILPIAVVLLCAAIAACDRLPTDNASAAPAKPSYHGGFTIGSGNEEAVEADTTDMMTTAGDTTGRGGYTIGSGN